MINKHHLSDLPWNYPIIPYLYKEKLVPEGNMNHVFYYFPVLAYWCRTDQTCESLHMQLNTLIISTSRFQCICFETDLNFIYIKPQKFGNIFWILGITMNYVDISKNLLDFSLHHQSLHGALRLPMVSDIPRIIKYEEAFILKQDKLELCSWLSYGYNLMLPNKLFSLLLES